ncbi:hypothetical protein GDO86_000414 [Hymenochirus boettgeri]|uniref:DUF4592 domain-containing protein n=1 Tax=Hymenochirus boettgeri TaxID=247094 RepID=A0A8T2KHD4_9PIPI|nr:hypothetical protein GDO86_000414 [Hymenochirus boettgeri]
MGTRAFSHESIFIPDGQAEDYQDIQALSQESIGGNVKTLQQHLAGNIRFGLRPDSISGRGMENLEVETSNCSPMEIAGEHDKGTHQKTDTMLPGSPGSFSAMNVAEHGQKTEEKVTPLKPSRSKRPLAGSGTIESINLDAVPRSVNRLDNSFAKHKLSIKPKNQRVSKKHRGMSQEYQSIEDAEYENESASSPKKSLDKDIFIPEQLSGHNLNKSDPIQSIRTEDQTVKNFPTLISKEEKHVKIMGQENRKEPNVEKRLEPTGAKHIHEITLLNEEEKQLQLEKEKREEEEEKNRQLQKQLEIKEQQRLEEGKRRRTEQILQELEEHRRQEELRLHEKEQKAIQQAEERRQEEERRRQEEQKRIEEQKQQEMQEELKRIEEQKQQEIKLLEKQTKQKNINNQNVELSNTADTILKDKVEAENGKMIAEVDQSKNIHKQSHQLLSEAQEQERSSEALRWQELDQRQRPYTFKVSSGEKQIIFQRVNLSPVTPSKEASVSTDAQDPKENKAIISPHTLPSALCVPHTAILVTGAQLCGTAVNLDQIKDSACKSLLGLTEEKKHLEFQITKAQIENQESKPSGSRTKGTLESLDSHSNLDEWTYIRSKILSKSENVSMLEKPKRNSHIHSDECKGEHHSNLRKTLSASAKFSITPAWQKFAEPTKAPEMTRDTLIIQSDMETTVAEVSSFSNSVAMPKSPERDVTCQETTINKKPDITEDSTEGFIFSKDLPSFLVPHPPQSPRRGQVESQTGLEAQVKNGMRKNDKSFINGEEKSPFGVKLRRTNYSLRFHSDPLNEQKRKKRYSAGDSIDSLPVSFSGANEKDPGNVSTRELSLTSLKVEKDTSNSLADLSFISSPLGSTSSSYIPSPSKARTVSKSPSVEKPSLAPKPSSPTPLHPVAPKLERSNLTDVSMERFDTSKLNSESLVECITSGPELQSPLSTSPSKNEDVESKDRKYSFPSISIPWRDKSEKRIEQISKDRPILQSRHSLDGTRLMEKAETDQPLWITLALQKQKGFREQQASREERRQAREAKQAEKLTKQNVGDGILPGEYRGRASSLQKPAEEKKCETIVTRLQRREQLQKSNTLPTSVTVEIADSVPALTKDIQKRFSTPDASPVSSEPAWLALAKRKSKAWSDCPQIIK